MAFASTAQAGITIPAGDWTVDLGGNVNAFYSHTKTSGTEATNSIGTGLLPAQLGVGAKTRQNDLDIAVQFSFFTSTSADAANGANGQALNRGAQINVRQAYLTFGDASWGSIKMGRDLGIYGSDAILSDFTLLSVGGNYAPGGTTTLGRIGQGYLYADWWGQISYTTPNWNGLQASAGVFQPVSAASNTNQGDMMFQGKVTYDFAANDVTGRVWLGGTTQDQGTYRSEGWDLGGKIGYQGAQLVAYYYDGQGLASVSRATSNTSTLGDTRYVAAPTTAYGRNVLMGGLNGSLGDQVKSDDSGGYVQATFTIPGVGTKLGASWGESMSTYSGKEAKVETWIVGAFHPLTKSLTLVAEYANATNKYTGMSDTDVKTTSLGAILFF